MRIPIAALALFLSSAALAEEDLSWVEKLPGISVAAKDGTRSAQYTIAGDAEAVFAKVKDGLTAHGWSIDKNVNLMGVHTIKAHKGAEKVKVVTTGGTISVAREGENEAHALAVAAPAGG